MHAPRTPLNNMPPQHGQNLAVLPPLRHRSIRRLEGTDRLSPLAAPGCALSPLVGFGLVHWLALCRGSGEGGIAAFRRFMRGRRRFLRGPVVDVPVVLVEEEVVLFELLGRHVGEVGVGEGGEEEVTF